MKSDLSNAAKKIANHRVLTDAYPTTHATMPALSFTSPSIDASLTNNVWYCLNSATDVYALGVVSKSGKGFVIRSDSSVYQYAGSGDLSPNNTCSEAGLSGWADTNARRFVGFTESASQQWTAWTGVEN